MEPPFTGRAATAALGTNALPGAATAGERAATAVLEVAHAGAYDAVLSATS